MACVWARPEPLTQLYGVASVASLAALALARAHFSEAWKPAKASAPLLPSSPARETWLDSTRFVLIVLIVMGHYVAIPCSYIAEQSYWLAPLLVWINLFVMPGFATLSGYLSKGALTQARLGRLLIFVLFPYILSKVIYWTWFSLKYGVVGWFDPFDAFSNSLGLEWYLIVLVQWRLAITLMSAFNNWALIGFSLAIGLVSGNWVPGSAALALQRACAFFPFFVLGYTVDLVHLREMVTGSTSCKIALRTLFVGALGLFFYSPGLARLFMANTLGDLNFDYASAIPPTTATAKFGPTGLMYVMPAVPRVHCGSEWALSFVHRFVRYEIGALLLLGLLAWVPSSSTIARYGQLTMYPYLLHPWVFQLWLMPFINRHLPVFLGSLTAFSTGGYIWMLMVVLAPVLTLALSSAPVRFLTGPYIEPTWLGALLLSSESQPRLRPSKGEPNIPLTIPKASA